MADIRPSSGAPRPGEHPDVAPCRRRTGRTALGVAWVANLLGTILYAGFLILGGRESLLYDRDGVLLLLPLVPIVAVYLYLLRETFPNRRWFGGSRGRR